MPYQDMMLVGERFCVQMALLISDYVSPDDATAESQCGSVAYVVTPLWQIPYEEKLQIN